MLRLWNVTGVPYEPKKAGQQLDKGALHCGCHWERAVFKFFLFKTGKIKSRMRKDKPGWSSKGWNTQYLHLHLHKLVLGQVQEVTTWCLDDIWMKVKDKEGHYVVDRLESLRLEAMIHRLQACLTVVKGKEEAEKGVLRKIQE
jgi:hypothetical protein